MRHPLAVFWPPEPPISLLEPRMPATAALSERELIAELPGLQWAARPAEYDQAIAEEWLGQLPAIALGRNFRP